MKNIKEFLNTGSGTEGSLLIVKKIADTLIAEVDKNIIPRSEAAMFFGPTDIPGSSVDVDLEDVNSLSIRLIAEGTEIVLDNSTYSSTNLKPKKYGVTIKITRELLEDGKWNMLQKNVERTGKKMAENETSLIVTDALDNAGNTVATGNATIAIANITRAMQYLEDNDFNPTSYFVGMEVLNDLRNIDTFVEFNKVGNTDMLAKGFLGNIYGMNVMKVSTNAGMTTTSSYVTDKSEAYALAEKRPVTVENFSLPVYDMDAASVTQRIVAKELRASAIAKITTT